MVLNTAVSSTELPDTAFIEGLSSGASGFAIDAGGNSATVKLRDTSGTFIAGEQIRINDASVYSKYNAFVHTILKIYNQFIRIHLHSQNLHLILVVIWILKTISNK